MASRTTWFCDRCDKEFKRQGFTRSVKIPKQISMLTYDYRRCFAEREYDLCDECIKDFWKFIGGGKVDGK